MVKFLFYRLLGVVRVAAGGQDTIKMVVIGGEREKVGHWRVVIGREGDDIIVTSFLTNHLSKKPEAEVKSANRK